jgi:hypothetical protein
MASMTTSPARSFPEGFLWGTATASYRELVRTNTLPAIDTPALTA